MCVTVQVDVVRQHSPARKEQKKKKFVHLLPQLLKIHCPHLPFVAFLKIEFVVLPRVFSVLVFPLDLLSTERSPRVNGCKLQVIINLLISQNIFNWSAFCLELLAYQ